jgi:hypothetical protein
LIVLPEGHDLQLSGAAERLADVVETFLEREPFRVSEYPAL